MSRCALTLESLVERIEDSDEYVDQNRKIERDVTPERHVRREPVQCWLMAQFSLPLHLFEYLGKLLEEVPNLRALFILFTGEEHLLPFFHRQKFAQLRHGKDN